MLYLILAILSSAMISIVMRISSDKVTGNLSMLAVNYLLCLVLSAVYAGFRVVALPAEGFPAVLGMGAVNGVLFLSGFLLLQINTRKNGIVLSSIFMKLGLLVPVALSVFLFGEIPTAVQIFGFCLAVGAIILINFDKNAVTAGSKVGLILMLLAAGTGDAMAKVFEVFGPTELSNQFLFVTFAVALILCLGLVIWKKERLGLKEIAFGLLIGVPNFFSAKFLLRSLAELPAVIVYPTYSVATILAVTLGGVLIFRERLKKQQWVALGVILIALVLLNI